MKVTFKELKEMFEDSEGEIRCKFIDDWLLPDQLTDEEFADFADFVDNYTGNPKYSNYQKQMPEDLFDEIYDAWLTKWEQEHPELEPEGGWLHH